MLNGEVAAFSGVVAACAWASDSITSHAESFAKRVDLGGGRMSPHGFVEILRDTFYCSTRYKRHRLGTPLSR
jgi:hypothetical protein